MEEESPKLWNGLLLLSIGVVGANSLVLSPIARDVASSFGGATASDVMLASAAYGAGTAISALFLSPRADLIGLGRALFFALTGLGVSLSLSAAASTIAVLVVAQGLAGLAAGVALPAVYGLAAEIAPRGKESETLGKVLTGWTLSLVAGVTLSAILSDWIHWRVVFVFLATLAIALAAVLHSSGKARKSDKKVGTKSSALRALKIQGLTMLLILVFGYMMAFYGLYAFLGTHLTEQLSLSTTLAGLSAMAYGIGFGAIAPLDRIIDRYGSIQTAPYVFATLMTAYLAMAGVSDIAVALIAMCMVWGAANHLGLNLLVGALTAIEPSQRGAILGLYSAVTYASMFLGTVLFKPLFEQQGFAATAILSAVFILPATFYAFIRNWMVRITRRNESSRKS